MEHIDPREWAQGGRVHWDKMSVCTTLIFATTRMMELLPAGRKVIRHLAIQLDALETIKADMKADYHDESHVKNLLLTAEDILVISNELYAKCVIFHGIPHMDDWKTSFLGLQGMIYTAIRYTQQETYAERYITQQEMISAKEALRVRKQ